MDECMAIWEPATHMTKAEWRRTCRRTLDRANANASANADVQTDSSAEGRKGRTSKR
jgi:hypothetical protein